MAIPKIQTKQPPRDAQSYLKDLEDLLKRNTGTGTHIGADTSSNIPMYVPGSTVASQVQSQAPSMATYGQAPAGVVRDIQPLEVPEEETGDVLGATDFLDQFNEVYNQAQPNGQGMDQSNPGAMATGVEQTADGGTLFSDGIIYYSDGTFRSGEGNAQPIATDQNGGTRYSDGSIRMSYEQLGLPQQSTPGGLMGLITGIFGQQREITQDFGNYNPGLEPGSGYNMGTDIRTRDLTGSQRQYKLPVGAEVVQVFRDDGTRFGDQTGHQGWGNSVLLRLPSGEMLRFSHMASMLDLQEGMRLNAGQVFGTPGQTGNTSGEHLDLEYYNAQGQLGNPSQFSGFTNPQSMLQPKLFSSPDDPQATPAQPAQQPVQQPVAQPQQQMPTPATDIFNAAKQVPQQVFNAQVAPLKPLAEPTANLINRVNPTGSAGLGITETLQGNPEGARQEQTNTLESLGTALKAPELQTSELSNLQKTNPFRQLAGNLLDTASTPLKKAGLPDFGISEALAGGKTVNTDVNLAPQASAFGENQSKPAQPQDYANVLGGNVKDALAQAGQGVKSLGQAGVSALESVFAPKQEVEKRAVGDVAGTTDGQTGQFSSVMDSAPSMSKVAPGGSVADSFFKYGGSEMYKDYLKPNAQDTYGGALKLDLFNDNFFKDLGNIGNVFGGSKDLGQATDKYIGYEKEKYKPMDKMNWEEGYDRGQVDNYNRQVDEYNNSLNNYFNDIRSSVSGSQSIFTPMPTAVNRNIFASGSSTPNMSVDKPQMSMAQPSFSGKSISKPNMSVNAPQMSVNRPSVSAPAPRVSGPMSKPNGTVQGPMSVAPKPAPRMSVAPKPAPQMSKAPVMSKAPNMSVAPKQSSYQAPKKNVFSTVSSYLSNIFRR